VTSLEDAWSSALERALPRLLSLQDRDATSATYGLFDRGFWAWNFADIAAPRAQEAVLPLAVLYLHRGAREPELLRWVGAGVSAWARLAHADGSFDEAYPWERSWGATAFTACAIAETLELVGSDLDPAAREAGLTALRRAARFLAENEETHGTLSNHLAAGASALDLAAQLAREPSFRDASRRLVDRIAREASPAGWLREYGGADPGYQTHALGYLAGIHRRGTDLRELLTRAVDFLAWTIGPDGALAAEVGSRNTSFFFPAGVELLGDELPMAAALALRARRAAHERTATDLDSMDAPNWIPMLASYARAHRGRCGVDVPMPLPCDRVCERWIDDAGLWIRSTRAYHVIVALRKGGVVAALGRDGTVLSSGGWVDGAFTSQGTGEVRAPRDGSARVVVPFRRRLDVAPGVVDHLALRVAAGSVGRLPGGARAIKAAIVRRLIARDVRGSLSLERTVRLDDDVIEIADRVSYPGRRPSALVAVERVAPIHMGSARYFQPRELAPRALTTIHERVNGHDVERTTRVHFATKGEPLG
jgi:hypothetical protein